MVAIMDDEKVAETVGHLEDEALKRKDRLKTLRQQKTFNNNKKSNDSDSEISFPKPIFRNYTPSDDVLKPGVLPKPNLINIEEQIKEQLENAKPEPLVEKEIDLATLAPHKIDWDLKREAEKKLKALEKRTQLAITELIKERLQKSKNPDFAELVSVGCKTSQVTVSVDDDDDD
jgi:coiled-coil domain-containing protein 12